MPSHRCVLLCPIRACRLLQGIPLLRSHGVRAYVSLGKLCKLMAPRRTRFPHRHVCGLVIQAASVFSVGNWQRQESTANNRRCGGRYQPARSH